MTRPVPDVYAARLAAANAALAALTEQLGAAGLAAARRSPGLLAAVDQHGAAVRDQLTDGTRPPGVIALAGYAQGLRDGAARLGWCPPSCGPVDWPAADWASLRLLAVCALAEAVTGA